MWIVIGVLGGYFTLASLVVYGLCVAAGEADKRMGAK